MKTISAPSGASRKKTRGFDTARPNRPQGTGSTGAGARFGHRTSSHATGLLVMVLVLLGVVIAIEILALAMVARTHVAQAQMRERLRAANPSLSRQCGRQVPLEDCLSRVSLTRPGT